MKIQQLIVRMIYYYVYKLYLKDKLLFNLMKHNKQFCMIYLSV